MGVFIILVIRHNRTIFANRFLNICRISPVLLTRLVSVSGIRVRRILECGRIHRTVFLCPHAAFFIFHNSLVRKASGKKLVLRHVFKICSAQMKQTAAVCEERLDNGPHVIISLMIENAVIVIRVGIMFQLFRNDIRLLFCEINNQL